MKKRISWVIFGCVILSMLVMGLFAHAFLTAALMAVGITDSLFALNVLSVVLVAFIWVSVLVGLLVSWSGIRAGGAVVARSLGAVQASNRSRYKTENTLLHAVAEMAIASHCGRPDVFVLRDEKSINSFALGSFTGDPAIVVTHGALEELTKDELTALVAHEYAHIANGDIPTNMKLMMALNGLLAIDQVGRMCVGNQLDGLMRILFVGLGWPIRVVGFFGVLSSAILRVLFSRHNEFDADVKAVEFLRQAKSLLSVLHKISQSSDCNVALNAAYVDEVRHLCIHAGNVTNWVSRLRSSHPPLASRIHEIDPNFFIRDKQDSVQVGELSQNTESGSSIQASVPDTSESRTSIDSPKRSSSFNVSTVSEESNAESIDEPAKARLPTPRGGSKISKFYGTAVANSRDDNLQNDELSEPGNARATHQLSDRGVLMMQEPASCLAALFALFLPSDEFKKTSFLNAVAFAYNQNFSDVVKHLGGMMARELSLERAGVIHFATKQLRNQLNPDACRRVLLNIERLLKAQEMHGLMNYSAVQHIRSRLDAEFPVLENIASEDPTKASQRFLKTFDQMGEEFSLLLSLVLECTELKPHDIDIEYHRLLSCYTSNEYPRRTGKDSGISKELEAAYELLSAQPQAIRESFVQHCVEISDLDYRESGERRSLMHVFSASLGCSNVFDRLPPNADVQFAQSA